MEGRNLDPYEQQLLAVFESCDETQVGSLDSSGLQQLCEKLQLEEQGLELVDYLLGHPSSDKRVTFTEFRDGLLLLLGQRQGDKTKSRGEGSPEREVSPKFVFGKKKYGRRSRPESAELDLEVDGAQLEESDSEIFGPVPKDDGTKNKSKSEDSSNPDVVEKQEAREAKNEYDSETVLLLDYKRTDEVAAEEACLRAAWEQLGVGQDGFLDRSELALVCQCIGMEKVAEEVVQQLFEKLDVDRDGRISFEEFLLLFRSGGSANGEHSPRLPTVHLKNVTSTTESDGQYLSFDPSSMSFVSCDSLVDLWASAGVPSPAQLLQDLGFSSQQTVDVSQLAAVLEEELRAAGSPGSPRETLLQAALALHQTEVRNLKSSLEHMGAERDKLRTDLSDANQRASLLAQEIDDHHARLEKSSQENIKLLELRHAEQLKEISKTLSIEREQLANQNLSLETQLVALQGRVKADLAAVQMENETLEKENCSLLEQLSEAEEAKLQLQREVEAVGKLRYQLRELEGSHEREQVQPLLDKLSALQAENKSLRDRNDELTVELEDLTCARVKKVQVVEGGATKRRGDSPLAPLPGSSSEEDSPRLGKVRRCCQGDCDTVTLEGLQIHGLSHREDSAEADLDVDDLESLYSDASCRVTPSADHCCDKCSCIMGEKITSLQSQLAKLKQEKHLRSEKPLVCEKNGGDLNVSSIEDKTLDFHKTSGEVKGQLKQVFQVLRQQAVQEYLEECALMSSQIARSQRNLESMLVYNCTQGKPLKTENLAFWGTSGLAVTSLNGMIHNPQDNAKDVEQLEQHCRDLKSELDQVKVEIVKILTEKKACSKENCALKIHISDLKNRFPVNGDDNCCDVQSEEGQGVRGVEGLEPSENESEVTKDISTSMVDSDKSKVVSISQKMYCVSEDCLGSVEKLGDKSRQMVSENGGAQDCHQTNNEKTTICGHHIMTCTKCGCEADVSHQITQLTVQLQEERMVCEREKRELLDRCAELDSSLELLRQEYEQCEEYWKDKLDEERLLFNQDQQESNERFAELCSKIREYEALAEGSDDTDRLSTIEERGSLEKQVTDLEEEYEELQMRHERDQAEKEAEISKLKEQLRTWKQQDSFGGVRTDVAVQVSDLENGSWESDRTFVVELDGGRSAVRNTKDGTPCALPTQNGCSSSGSQSSSSSQDEGVAPKAVTGTGLHNGLPAQYMADWGSTKPGGQACRIDLNVLQAMNARLRQQEHQIRQLELALKQQQQHMDTILKHTWQQHKDDMADLQLLLQNTQDKLHQQTLAYKEQSERLVRSDLLMKDLFVENSYLIANVQQLEQKCQMLIHITPDSSSV